MGYREMLMSSEQQMQDSYDKSILSLSGGALGISFVFVKDLLGGRIVYHPLILFLAWLFWAASISCILFSFFSSRMAFRHALVALDSETIKPQKPGGLADCITFILNICAGLFFIAGTVVMSYFAFSNFSTGDQ